jgi:hypothetical protein
MNKRTIELYAAISSALLLTGGVASAEPDSAFVRLSTGVEYTSGTFGATENIDDLYVPVTAGADIGRFGFRLTVPYLSVRAPLEIAETGEDGQPVAGSGTRVTESGLGDVIAGVTLYDVIDNRDLDLVVDVTGTVKFGTADIDKGLGTGENDYSVRFDAYKFLDRAILMGSVGYRFRGEPAGVELNDVLLGSVGGAYEISSDTLIGVYYDYRQSALDDRDDIQELTGFASTRISEHWSLEIYAFAGFTDSSPDWGGGVSISTDFQSFRHRT